MKNILTVTLMKQYESHLLQEEKVSPHKNSTAERFCVFLLLFQKKELRRSW